MRGLKKVKDCVGGKEEVGEEKKIEERRQQAQEGGVECELKRQREGER